MKVVCPPYKPCSFQIILQVVPSSRADNDTTRVAWILLLGMQMHVTSNGLSTLEAMVC